MAVFKKGDMWQRLGQVDLFCITTNSTIKQNGSLVMGRGIASQAKKRLPQLPGLAAKLIRVSESDYGFVVVGGLHPVIGLFQVKRHFSNKADLGLIKLATIRLFQYIVLYNLTVCLNFPGIGNGRLSRDEVLPIVGLLPDNVEIWEADNA
jgi:hypothetical protein